MLIDALARQQGIHLDKLQHSAAVGRGRLCDKRVLLAKPMTFMNNSGESVGKLARYYKVTQACFRHQHCWRAVMITLWCIHS